MVVSLEESGDLHMAQLMPLPLTVSRKLRVEEWLVSAVMSMYAGVKTVVRTVYGNCKGFEVKVGMHQGSGLSPLLFVIVMEAISRAVSYTHLTLPTIYSV